MVTMRVDPPPVGRTPTPRPRLPPCQPRIALLHQNPHGTRISAAQAPRILKPPIDERRGEEERRKRGGGLARKPKLEAEPNAQGKIFVVYSSEGNILPILKSGARIAEPAPP